MVVMNVVVMDVVVVVLCVLARRKRVKTITTGVKNMVAVGLR